METTNFPIIEISKLAEKESWRKEINRPIYNLHKWWAQRLGSVFRAILIHLLENHSDDEWELFYKTHTHSTKIVLDPFMGSGTTLGEALKLGAKTIGCDINPISSFLVKQELTNISLNEIAAEMDKLSVTISNEIKQYYKTIDPNSGKEIPVLYYFWVKIVSTTQGEQIPLFSKYIFSQDAYPSKKPKAQIICPNCWKVFEGKYNDTSAKCPHCFNIFNPQEGRVKGSYVYSSSGEKFKIKDLLPKNRLCQEKLFAILALRENGDKIYLSITPKDIELLKKAKTRLSEENLPLPTLAVRNGHNTNQAKGYSYLYWKDFFNPRQQLCLGLLLREILKIKNKKIQEQFLCLFSSTLEFNNSFCSYKGEGTGAVRPIFFNHILKPERTPLENSVWGEPQSSGCFSTLYKTRFLKAKEYLNYPFEIKANKDNNKYEKVISSQPLRPIFVDNWNDLTNTNDSVWVFNGDSARLPIPDNSVDLVVTDPPYFDYIHYSELSDFFYAWLSPILENRYPEFQADTSERANEVQHIEANKFSNLLSRVLVECNRVMKENAKLCFSFHHSQPNGWIAIANALISSNLYIEEAFPVHAESMSSTPKATTKEPISLDIILVCGKRETLVNDSWEDIALEYQNILCNGTDKLSRSDIFVIKAGQIIAYGVNKRLGEKEIFELLLTARNNCNSIDIKEQSENIQATS